VETIELPLFKEIAQARINEAEMLVMHNAKFDMHMLASIGIQFKKPVWDTQVMARVQYNDYLKYSLEACGERLGVKKDDTVKKWLDKNKAFSKCPDTGEKKYYYDRAPWDMLKKYAEQDTLVTEKLYLDQVKHFDFYNKSHVRIDKVAQLELATTKVLYEMERTGIKLDTFFCKLALSYEENRGQELLKKLRYLCGGEFVDSAKFLQPIFDKKGIHYGRTEKGNAQFDYEALSKSRDTSELARTILEYRDSEKRGTTYFKGLLRYCGTDGRIHASIRQSGTVSGRFSCSGPNVQNWPANEEDSEVPVRRALRADTGFSIVSMDYAQMELRLMVDEADEMSMVHAINTGVDFHSETAKMAGVSRNIAKSARFAKLYGAGYKKLAKMLGISEAKANEISTAIDQSSPNIASYTRSLIDHINVSDFGWNWLGRRYYVKDKKFAYTYPNLKIQGGCSDILRLAMCHCYKKLEGKLSKLLIPIHDELVFMIHDDEHDLIPVLKDEMIRAFISKKHLDMGVSVSIGKNFWDLEEWDGKKTGD
jgi:DNA polymerase-1